MSQALQATVRFGYRLATVAFILLLVLVASSILFVSHGISLTLFECIPIAVVMFPSGFQRYCSSSVQGPMVLLFGWSFYAICLLVLLVNRQKTAFIITAAMLVVALGFNLYGCSQMIHK